MNFASCAFGRYSSVLYPLERKISDAKSRELVIYIWAHAVVASVPVFAGTNVADIYAMSTCTEVWINSWATWVYVLSTIPRPMCLWLWCLLLNTDTPGPECQPEEEGHHSSTADPTEHHLYPLCLPAEAELPPRCCPWWWSILCSVPYATLVIYQTVLNVPDTSVFLCCSRPFGCPKSLLANPVLFLTVNKSVRKCL